jgi:hypothetical protein
VFWLTKQVPCHLSVAPPVHLDTILTISFNKYLILSSSLYQKKKLSSSTSPPLYVRVVVKIYVWGESTKDDKFWRSYTWDIQYYTSFFIILLKNMKRKTRRAWINWLQVSISKIEHAHGSHHLINKPWRLVSRDRHATFTWLILATQ